MADLVTVITPTVGRQSLKRAIDSVAHQSIRARHIVVLDRPEKEDYVRAIIATSPSDRVRLLVTKGGVGPAAARNIAVSCVDTPWLGYLDDDDWYEPDHLAELLRELESRGYAEAIASGDASVIASSGFIFHKASGAIEYLPVQPLPNSHGIGDYLTGRASLRFQNGIVTPSLLIPTGLALEAKWDERLRNYEDWDLLLRLVHVCSANLIQSSKHTVHISQGSPGSLSKSRSWTDGARWLEGHRQYLSRKSASDFLAAEVLRAALTQRSVRGVAYCVIRLCKRPCSVAAFIVGMSGMVRR